MAAIVLSIDPRATLLDALREQPGLTGTKKGCDHGQCGACTVLVNGRRVNSCLTLAVMHDGDAIMTIEGLAGSGCAASGASRVRRARCVSVRLLHPRSDHVGCRLLAEGRAASMRDVGPRYMSGNICRCGALSEYRRGDSRPAGRAACTLPLLQRAAPVRKRCAKRPQRAIHRRRHDPARLDEGSTSSSADGRRYQPPALAAIDGRRERIAHRRAGAAIPTSPTHPRRRARFPGPGALRSGAFGQLRNMASIGRQSLAAHALRRTSATTLALQQARAGQRLRGHLGVNSHIAILGDERACIATHPSDLAVALTALEANILLRAQAANATCRSTSFTCCRVNAGNRNGPRAGRADHLR